jgi:hypothetical protein
MNRLKIGCNFSDSLIEFIKNSIYRYPNVKITEVFGSRSESSLLTARPKFRLPDISRNDFTEYVKSLSEMNVDFNYTLNANTLGGKKDILKNRGEILRYIEFLVSSGVKVLTVSLPLMAEYIRKVSADIRIEISAIAHIDSISELQVWKEKYGINKICVNISKNREIIFLTKLAEYCKKRDIIVTLIANEFCGNGVMPKDGESIVASNCIYRDHCYCLHSLDYGTDDELDDNYPMGRCIESRNDNSVWLKLYFIRPEDMKLYNSIGINNFKITGRTSGFSFLEKVVTAYLKESHDGDLLDLWKHPETIGASEDLFVSEYSLPNYKLEGFLQYWFKNPEHRCSNELCGETCAYCNDFYRDRVLMNRLHPAEGRIR